jgi:hypothetical protein
MPFGDIKLPLVPMAALGPPIAFKSRFHAGEWEENHHQYTVELVTCRSPKLCTDSNIRLILLSETS